MMNGHTWQVDSRPSPDGYDREHRAVCECGYASPYKMTREAALTAAYGHLKAVQRARQLGHEARQPIPPHPVQVEPPHITRARMAQVDAANKRLREAARRRAGEI